MKPCCSNLWNVCPGRFVAAGACRTTTPHLSRDHFFLWRKPFSLSFEIFFLKSCRRVVVGDGALFHGWFPC